MMRDQDAQLQQALMASLSDGGSSGSEPIGFDDRNPYTRKRAAMSTPAGLRNVGNTCYVNSILQTYEPPNFITGLGFQPLNFPQILPRSCVFEDSICAAWIGERIGGGGSSSSSVGRSRRRLNASSNSEWLAFHSRTPQSVFTNASKVPNPS